VCVEAEYAFNTQKRIVALRLEPDYNPDGWLGPLVRNNLWYDFSSSEKFEGEWSKLHDKLKELSSSTGNYTFLMYLCSLLTLECGTVNSQLQRLFRANSCRKTEQ